MPLRGVELPFGVDGDSGEGGAAVAGAGEARAKVSRFSTQGECQGAHASSYAGAPARSSMSAVRPASSRDQERTRAT